MMLAMKYKEDGHQDLLVVCFGKITVLEVLVTGLRKEQTYYVFKAVIAEALSVSPQ